MYGLAYCLLAHTRLNKWFGLVSLGLFAFLSSIILLAKTVQNQAGKGPKSGIN